jgi:hypothetical protein
LRYRAEQDAREKASSDQAIDFERQAAEFVQEERDLAIERVNRHKQFYRSVTKKAGIRCRILNVLTLGIIRCQ